MGATIERFLLCLNIKCGCPFDTDKRGRVPCPECGDPTGYEISETNWMWRRVKWERKHRRKNEHANQKHL